MPGSDRKRNSLKREFFFWGILLLVTAVDLGSKSLAFRGAFDHIPMLANKVKNRGITFGLFDRNLDRPGEKLSPGGIFLVLVGFLLVGFLLWFRYTHPHVKTDVVTALLAGGALGNIYDRVMFGYVRDFIRWPTFNLADVFICAGVAYFALETLYGGKERKRDGEGRRSGTDRRPE